MQETTLPFSISQDFKFKRLLGYNSQQKTVSLLGEVCGEHCIFVSEKTHFPIDSDEAVQRWISLIQQPNNQGLQQIIINTKYHMFSAPVERDEQFNLLKISL